MWKLGRASFRELPGLEKFDGGSDLVPTYACRPGHRRAPQRNNGASQLALLRGRLKNCLSSPHPETRQFSSSLYVLSAFLFFKYLFII